jgi:hypothetical protein
LEFAVTRCSISTPLDSSTWSTSNWGEKVTQGNLVATTAFSYPVFMWPEYLASISRLLFTRATDCELTLGSSIDNSYREYTNESNATFYSMDMDVVKGEPVASMLRDDVGGPTPLQFMRLEY